MSASAAHSLGSQAEVGVRSTAMKSTRSWNSSGRTRRSGRRKRKRATTPGGREESDEGEQIPRPTSRKDVHQQERDPRPHGRWRDEERGHDQKRGNHIGNPTPVDHAVRGQNGDGHERHHPGGVHERLYEPSQIQLQSVHRRCVQQFEVAGQEIRGQRTDHVRQQQDRSECQESESKELGCEQVPDPLRVPEVQQHAEDAGEQQGPEHGAHGAEDDHLGPPTAVVARSIQPSPKLDRQQPAQAGPESGNTHPNAPSKLATRSSASTPPVTLRKISSRPPAP